jgi:SAM-dependent methyltransferase
MAAAMDEYLQANREHWDELVDYHVRSPLYDVAAFKAGRNTLDAVIREGVGDVAGKTLLHLQCHFGLDTLSWARLGARVTGVDFSPRAVAAARKLAAEVGLAAAFVCSDVYDLPSHLGGDFDVVFTSYGVLPWLPDLERWAKVAARFVKPGGLFFVADTHPFLNVFDDESAELRLRYPYFNREAMGYDETGSYAVPDAAVKHTRCYEWQHSVGELLNAVVAAGLRVESYREYPFTFDRYCPALEKDAAGFWRLPGRDVIPLMFALRAVKG